jgi:hypothetical protein
VGLNDIPELAEADRSRQFLQVGVLDAQLSGEPAA